MTGFRTSRAQQQRGMVVFIAMLVMLAFMLLYLFRVRERSP